MKVLDLVWRSVDKIFVFVKPLQIRCAGKAFISAVTVMVWALKKMI